MKNAQKCFKWVAAYLTKGKSRQARVCKKVIPICLSFGEVHRLHQKVHFTKAHFEIIWK